MGWFSGWSNSANASDPAKQLDPSLKKFLEKESPDAYTPAKPTATAPPPSAPAKPTRQSSSPSTATPSESSSAAVPPESLYPDGRFAHVWKSYESLNSVEARTKSDQEKLSDIIDAFNDRQTNIKRAALENCAFQQLALSDCFRTGSWGARMTMCRQETRALDRCFTMQARFLKALGYLSVLGRGEEEEERVQMHADRLYQRMLAQERLVEEAKAKGEEPPTFGSILNKENVLAAMKGEVTPGTGGAEPVRKEDEARLKELEQRDLVKSLDDLEGLAPKARKEFENRLKGLHGLEREIELKAIQGDWAENRVLAKQVEWVYELEKQARLERKEKGSETVGDTIKKWWGW